MRSYSRTADVGYLGPIESYQATSALSIQGGRILNVVYVPHPLMSGSASLEDKSYERPTMPCW